MRRRALMIGAGMMLAAGVWALRRPVPLSRAAFAATYATPLAPPAGPVATYHLGHSLVGRDMPAMLAAWAGHDHASQLGWGTSLAAHRSGEVAGFDTENAHPAYRPADAALASGEYDVVVLTEMVEIRDAIRWHDAAGALAHWARAARAGNPLVRVYLYETWHALDDPEGWLTRLDADLTRHWEDEVLRPALAESGVGAIHVIPAGQVMAAAVRAMEEGAVPGLTDRRQLFGQTPEGAPDQIHLGDWGNWLVALTHHAVIYHRLPEAAPMLHADGSPATPLPPGAEAALRQVVWRVVTGYPASGVAPARG